MLAKDWGQRQKQYDFIIIGFDCSRTIDAMHSSLEGCFSHNSSFINC